VLHIRDYIVMVRSLVGCRYAHAGRSRDGMDCVGVVVVPLNEMGIYPPDESNYSREAFDHTLAAEIGKRAVAIDPQHREAGDIVLFWCNRRTRMPQHVAVLVGADDIVHAYMPLGRVVESPMGGWARRITHVFRIPPTMLART
jgi:cell wall-associated NlpC family hydrolase